LKTQAPRPAATKILAPARAASWVRALQKKGRKVVFTNGCFDLLHSGHVAYLEEARRLGDALIVALNGDGSVRRLKGKDRPLVTLKDRARVIAALESVDAVTWFHSDDPGKLIASLLPKVLVKGGDWTVDKIIGARDVLEHGGKVMSLQFVRGRSTTRLIQKARGEKK
jgi:D-glycero-beta-D-manno-heptose 1-phosphate adenylyltransferase